MAGHGQNVKLQNVTMSTFHMNVKMSTHHRGPGLVAGHGPLDVLLPGQLLVGCAVLRSMIANNNSNNDKLINIYIYI